MRGPGPALRQCWHGVCSPVLSLLTSHLVGLPSAWSGWSQPRHTRACHTRVCDLSWVGRLGVWRASSPLLCLVAMYSNGLTRWAGGGAWQGAAGGLRRGPDTWELQLPLPSRPRMAAACPGPLSRKTSGHSAAREDGVSPHPLTRCLVPSPSGHPRNQQPPKHPGEPSAP